MKVNKVEKLACHTHESPKAGIRPWIDMREST